MSYYPGINLIRSVRIADTEGWFCSECGSQKYNDPDKRFSDRHVKPSVKCCSKSDYVYYDGVEIASNALYRAMQEFTVAKDKQRSWDALIKE